MISSSLNGVNYTEAVDTSKKYMVDNAGSPLSLCWDQKSFSDTRSWADSDICVPEYADCACSPHT